MHFPCLIFAILLPVTPAIAQAAPPVAEGELPRLHPTEPSAAPATFEVEPGFSLVLAAHEPAVVDPIAMAFDERGRAYVIEMRGYSERRDEALGRIKLLTDDDHDGTFDRAVVFKEGLRWPTAIACFRGGVFVGATPDVYYFRDSDGDGVADEERHVFSGFGGGKLRLNMQALFNSFRWGPDNRIWGATAANGGTVSRPGSSDANPVPLRGADFSFDPETLDLRAENGTAQYGLSFDSAGRRFVCSNSRHLIWVAYERGQTRANPWFPLPEPLVDIPADGAAAPVYRISPDEPWRIVRTRWRVSGVTPGIVEGGGRVSGYFTAATGCHLYWGDAFGADFRDNAFIGDAGSNLVHRKRITADGGTAGLVARRARPDETTEFLRSRDNWFRPTSFATGPDGCLYLTDMYREVIEHPWSLPETIKTHLDLNSGWDRGRIYRVAPAGFVAAPIPDLATAADAELVALLEHPNDWHQTTARRLLFERGRPAPAKPAVAPFPALLSARAPLLDRLEAAAGDPWLRAAVLQSLRRPDDLRRAWGQAEALRAELAGMVGRSGEDALVEMVAATLARGDPDPGRVAAIAALRDGMRFAGHGWDAVAAAPRWEALLDQARGLVAEQAAAVPERLAAIRLLDLIPQPATQGVLRRALAAGGDDPRVREATAAAIGDTVFLLGHFSSLPPAAREALGSRALDDPAAAAAVLGALDAGDIELADLPARLVQGLRHHPDATVQARAATVLPPVVSRPDVVAAYGKALDLPGDAERGRAVFARACQVCHRARDGEGNGLGPPVATFAAAGRPTLLGHILDPNREVAPRYQAFAFTLEGGPPATGIIVTEDGRQITVREPGGAERTFPRDHVLSMTGLGLSLMPEGLEAAIPVEDMADLLAYLEAGS